VFGEITIESGDILSTIQDGLGMDPEEAKTVLFSILHNKERRLIGRITPQGRNLQRPCRKF